MRSFASLHPQRLRELVISNVSVIDLGRGGGEGARRHPTDRPRPLAVSGKGKREMTASYRRAANDVGEGTDFRLVSLRILPGPHRHKTPQPSTASAQPPGAVSFGRMIPSPHGRVAGRTMPLADSIG
jgi:hypothetical protein